MNDCRFALLGCIMAITSCSASYANGTENELRAVLSAQRSYFECIKTIQFDYKKQVTWPKGSQSTMKGRFAYSGTRYFSELMPLTATPNKEIPSVPARCGSNGKLTWQLNPDSRILNISRNLEYGKVTHIDNPLLMAFGWADIPVGESSMRLASEAGTWASSRFTLLTTRHKPVPGGQHLIGEFLLSRNRRVPNRIIVEFAPELGLFPIVSEVRSVDAKTGREYSSARISVLEVTTVTASGKALAFPKKIETHLMGLDGQSRKRTTDVIDTGEDVFRINQPVDESLFEFETNLPEGVVSYDLDRRGIVTSGSQYKVSVR